MMYRQILIIWTRDWWQARREQWTALRDLGT